MNDLELIKRIAEIEGYKYYSDDNAGVVFAKYERPEDGSLVNNYLIYNPLTLSVNCYLRDKYEVFINYHYKSCQIVSKSGDNVFTFEYKDEGINRAVLLCIVRASEVGND